MYCAELVTCLFFYLFRVRIQQSQGRVGVIIIYRVEAVVVVGLVVTDMLAVVVVAAVQVQTNSVIMVCFSNLDDVCFYFWYIS